MRREWLAAGGLVAVVVVVLLTTVLFPGALADRTDRTDPRPEADLRMEEISISAADVGGERLGLATDVRLAHTNGISENVTVELRAVGLDSGLVETSETVEVGSVDDDGELSATETLRVERGGSYRVEVIVFQNGVRQTTGSKSVRGTDALTPGYPENPVEFHQFARHDLPVIEYQIATSDGTDATLDVGTYVTNSGEARADNLSLVFQARQVESGIVADEQEVDVESVGPSQTARPETELTVPGEYNYYLDATLWRDGVIVDTARAGATLDPTEVVPANETERDVELEIGDFDSRGPDDGETDDEEAGDDAALSEDGSGPGFGIGAAILAVVVGIGLRARLQTGGKQ